MPLYIATISHYKPVSLLCMNSIMYFLYTDFIYLNHILEVLSQLIKIIKSFMTYLIRGLALKNS